MLLKTSHTTTYRYSLPARSSINELRLTPEHSPYQSPHHLSITTSPLAELQTTRDLHGNLIHHFTIEDAHEELTITADSEVETHSYRHQPEKTLSQSIENISTLKQNEELYPFLSDSSCIPSSPETWREAIDLLSNSEKSYGHLAQTLSQHIFENCEYREQHLHHLRTSTEIQAEKWGTCQDFAHLLIAYLRALGIPARYRSGYLYDPGLDTQNSTTESKQAQLIGSGVTHAWVDFFTPSIGWTGIDPTNNCWTNDHYLSLAQGRDYHDVVPIQGSLLGGGSDRQLDVQLTVKQIED